MTEGRKTLYRNPGKGRIAGVCAGVADYTGMETWLVRIIWFSGLLLSGGFFFVAYVAAWFILDKRPGTFNPKGKGKGSDQWHRFDEGNLDRHIEVKRKVWQAGEPPKQAYRDIVRQFDGIERRIQHLEGYVTSSEFTLKRQFNNL